MIVVISSPTDASTVYGPFIAANGTADDADTVVSVKWAVDGATWHDVDLIDSEIGVTEVSWSVVAIPLAVGSNTISVRATDGLDETSAPVTVTVTRSSDSFAGNHGAHWCGRSGGPPGHWDGIGW